MLKNWEREYMMSDYIDEMLERLNLCCNEKVERAFIFLFEPEAKRMYKINVDDIINPERRKLISFITVF